jgi:hypothetical protein
MTRPLGRYGALIRDRVEAFPWPAGRVGALQRRWCVWSRAKRGNAAKNLEKTGPGLFGGRLAGSPTMARKWMNGKEIRSRPSCLPACQVAGNSKPFPRVGRGRTRKAHAVLSRRDEWAASGPLPRAGRRVWKADRNGRVVGGFFEKQLTVRDVGERRGGGRTLRGPPGGGPALGRPPWGVAFGNVTRRRRRKGHRGKDLRTPESFAK